MSGDELRVRADVLAPLERNPKLAHLAPTFTMILRNRDWTGEGQNGKGRQRIEGWCVVSRAWVAEYRNISKQTAGKHIAQLLELGVLTLWRDSNSQHGYSREFLVTALAKPAMLAEAEQRAEKRAERRAEAAARRERLATEGPREVEHDAKGHFRRSDRSTRLTPTIEAEAVGIVGRGRMDTAPTSVSYLCEEDLCELENGPVVPTSGLKSSVDERNPKHAAAYRVRIFNALKEDHDDLDDRATWTAAGLFAIAWFLGLDIGNGFDKQRTENEILDSALMRRTKNKTYSSIIQELFGFDAGDGYDITALRWELVATANQPDLWTSESLAVFAEVAS